MYDFDPLQPAACSSVISWARDLSNSTKRRRCIELRKSSFKSCVVIISPNTSLMAHIPASRLKHYPILPPKTFKPLRGNLYHQPSSAFATIYFSGIFELCPSALMTFSSTAPVHRHATEVHATLHLVILVGWSLVTFLNRELQV